MSVDERFGDLALAEKVVASPSAEIICPRSRLYGQVLEALNKLDSSMSALGCSHQPRLIALGVSKHKPTSCPKFFKHPALIGQMRVQPPMLLLLVNRRRICGTVSRSITIIGAVHLGHCHATGRGGPPLPGESMTADYPFPRMRSNPILRAIKSGTCPANCGRS